MKVDKTSSLRPVSRISKKKNISENDSSNSETVEVSDVATLRGIPPTEMTPKVRTAILGLMEEVSRLNQELEQKNKRIDYLEKLADEDPLGPILNRRAFIRELSRSIDFANRYDQPSSLIFIDVNNMKGINDTYGHAAGDAALATIVKIILEHTRSTDIVGRLGGDEFGLILRQAPKDIVDQKINFFSAQIKETGLHYQDKIIPLGAAFGGFTFTGTESIEQILTEADSKMYENKKRSKEE